MRTRRSSRAACAENGRLPVALVAFATACSHPQQSSDKPRSEADAAAHANPQREDAAAAPPGSFNAGESEPLSVELSATRTTLCPGECVTLTANVTGGNAPYDYSWSHGLESKAGVTVCPVGPTTYQVTVEDTAATREFVADPARVQASVSVSVSRECLDGGRPVDDAGFGSHEPDAGVMGAGGSSGDVGGDAGVAIPSPDGDAAVKPPTALEVNCQMTATVEAGPTTSNGALLHGFGLPSPLAVDPSSNWILSVGFQGTVDLGDVVLDDRAGNYAFLVAKYDAQCRRLWSRSYGGLLSWAGGASVAASGSDTVLAGIFAGAVDFGRGLLLAGSLTGAMLFKLDAAGNTLWSRAFVSTSGSEFFDVAVDAGTGAIVATGFTSGNISFGGGTVSAEDQRLPFVVKFTAGGDHVWSRPAPSVDDVARVRVLPNGDIVLANESNGAMQLHRLGPDGAERWSARYEVPAPGWVDPPLGLAVGPADSIVTATFFDGVSSGLLLTSTSADGQSHKDVSLPREDPDPYAAALAVSRGGLLLEASDRPNTTDREVSSFLPGREAVLSAYAETGQVMATARYDTELQDAPLGLVVDVAEHPILAVTTGSSESLSGELTVLRYDALGL